MANPIVHSPYKPPVRSPKAVHNRKRLEELIATMEGRARPEYLAEQTQKNRNQFLGMAERLGDEALADAVNKLSDDQFDVLWNYSGMPLDMSLWYITQKLIDEGNTRHPLVQAGAIDGAKIEYAKLVKWAGKLKIKRNR